MSAVAVTDATRVPGVRVGDWLMSGALHAVVITALWQFAMAGASLPIDVQRLELSVRWAAEPQAVAATHDAVTTPVAAPVMPPRPAESVAAHTTRPATIVQDPIVSDVRSPRLTPKPSRRSSEPPTTSVAEVPVAATPIASPDADGQWHRDLERLLREHMRYPLKALRMRQQGVVMVEANISPDGQLLRCDVAESSGYRSLDEAAIELVHTATALLHSKQVPGALAELRIPIAFELSGS